MSFDGIDQSWGYADPATAAKAGVKVVSMYLSNDPSKNATTVKIDAYHKAGIGVILNWENQPGAPLSGSDQGTVDATAAVKLAKALGAPAGVCIYFSCDRDLTGADWAKVLDYYRATGQIVHAAGYGNGCYGEADLVHRLSAAAITDAEWQTYAWSAGVLDPAADFYQYSNNQTVAGASVDLDRIIHPAELGAWWPVNSPYAQEDTVTPADLAEIKQVVQNNIQVARDQIIAAVKATNQNVTKQATAVQGAVLAALPAGQATYSKADLEAALSKALDGATIQTGA